MPGIWRHCLTALLTLSGALTFGAPLAIAQSDYPNRPVRIVVPFPAAGIADHIGRPLAERLSRALGQQFVIENRGGASGALGAEAVAKAVPDGYTIMITSQVPLVVLPNLRKIAYDPLNDFLPVARMGEVGGGLAVHPSLGVTTLRDFIALAKRNPGKYSFVSAGIGTITHLRGEMLKLVAEIDLLHVPYKGNSEALPDLLAGNVHAMLESIVFPHVKSGRLTMLAVLDDERHPDFPNVPTIKEAGLPDYNNLPIWFGLYAPRGTPPPIVERLRKELALIHDDKEFAARMMTLGIRVYATAEAPAEISKQLTAQTLVYGDIIRKAKIAME